MLALCVALSVALCEAYRKARRRRSIILILGWAELGHHTCSTTYVIHVSQQEHPKVIGCPRGGPPQKELLRRILLKGAP